MNDNIGLKKLYNLDVALIPERNREIVEQQNTKDHHLTLFWIAIIRN
jgi:hypothetical protein